MPNILIATFSREELNDQKKKKKQINYSTLDKLFDDDISLI